MHSKMHMMDGDTNKKTIEARSIDGNGNSKETKGISRKNPDQRHPYNEDASLS